MPEPTAALGAVASALECAECGFANVTESAECEACGANLYRARAAQRRRDEGDDQLLSDAVAALVTRAPLLAEAGSSVAEAGALMREQGSGYVLVVDAGHVRGIFTEGDLLERVVAAGRAPRAVTVEQVMTRDPVVLRHDDSVAVAIHKMVLGAFHHLPLVDAAGHVRGVVSEHEVLRHLHRLLQVPAPEQGQARGQGQAPGREQP